MGAVVEKVNPPESSPESRLRVATIDEDPTTRQLIRHWLSGAGYDVFDVVQIAQLSAFLERLPDIVCLDVSFSQGRGLELLREIHTLAPNLPVIIMGSQHDAETAVSAMRSGAKDYVSKPLEAARLRTAVSRACDQQHLIEKARRSLGEELRGRTLDGPLGGHTKATKELDALVAKVVTRDVAVCLNAEKGSGAELVAFCIHQKGPRKHGPFVELDCGALSLSEQERSLFGEESASAVLHRGAFERANGGVLFLRQVGILGHRVQAGLAQALSDKHIRRVGGQSSLPVNVRIVAAHEGDLRELVDTGELRDDLFFRLVVYPVRVPPLRERRDDIPLIVSYFLQKLSPETKAQMAPEALEALMSYPWPGNLRELEHVVHRGLLMASGPTIGFSDLPEELRQALAADGPLSNRRSQELDWMHFPENEVVPLRELEKRAIEHALRVTGGSVSVAAQKLGIGRATLYRRIASFELSLNVA